MNGIKISEPKIAIVAVKSARFPPIQCRKRLVSDENVEENLVKFKVAVKNRPTASELWGWKIDFGSFRPKRPLS